MKKIILLLIVLTNILHAEAQKKWQKSGLTISTPVCYASGKVEKSFIPPDPDILKRLKSSEIKSNISVTYSLFPSKAKEAFEYAVSLWNKLSNLLYLFTSGQIGAQWIKMCWEAVHLPII